MQPLGNARTTHDRRLVGRWAWEQRVTQYCLFFAVVLCLIMAILITAGLQTRQHFDNGVVYAVYLLAIAISGAGAWRLWQTRPRGQADGQ